MHWRMFLLNQAVASHEGHSLALSSVDAGAERVDAERTVPDRRGRWL